MFQTLLRALSMQFLGPIIAALTGGDIMVPTQKEGNGPH